MIDLPLDASQLDALDANVSISHADIEKLKIQARTALELNDLLEEAKKLLGEAMLRGKNG